MRIDFPYPFSGFDSLSFLNCFASVHMFLEGVVGVDDYDCPARNGEPCNGCGCCNGSTSRKQELTYFLLDTLSGRSSVRPAFLAAHDDTPNSPETIDFLMGLAGYRYRVVAEGALEEARASIDRGTPVLARMTDPSHGAFRVLIGYEGDGLIAPDPTNAQGGPTPPACADVAEVVVITAKEPPRLSLVDGLARIRSVMRANLEAGVWAGYRERFDYWGGKLPEVPFEELRERFARICQIAWHNFNCHNFAETFRHRIWEPLQDPRLDEVCRQIDESYDNAHTRNWQLIGLHECRDWSRRRYNELEWGYCGCVLQCLEKLEQYDAEVLAAVEKAIAIVGGEAGAEPPGQGR